MFLRSVLVSIASWSQMAEAGDTGVVETAVTGGESAFEPRQLSLEAGEVYAARTVVRGDDTQEFREVGSLQTRDRTGRVAWIDPRDDVSPDGSQYVFTFRAYQQDEWDPVVYETRVRRVASGLDAAVAAPPLRHRVDASVLSVPDAEVVSVTVRLGHPEKIPHLPQLGTVTIDAYLDAAEARVRAIEGQRGRILERARPLSDLPEVRSGDVRVGGPSWSMQSILLEGSGRAIRSLLQKASFDEAFVEDPIDLTSNDGLAIRTSTQVGQFFTSGFDGQFPTGRSSVTDIYAGIWDIEFDTDHPAWLDSSGGSSRLLDVFAFNGTNWTSGNSGGATASNNHGTRVAGMFVADLLDGQDPNFTSLADQRARTGTSAETSFAFVGATGASQDQVADLVVSENFDVVNHSIVVQGSPLCATNSSYHDSIDRMFLDGTFVVQPGGNQDNCGSTWATCAYARPAGAAGGYAVNALAVAGVDLDTAPVAQGCRGGDALGRSVIAIVAPGGRETATTATFDNAYTSSGPAVSFAAPVVSGAVADLRDLLAQTRSSIATDAGFVQSIMGLMGDGQTGPIDGSGATALLGDAFDPIWGAGRLRMRMFTDEGMDAPWEFGAQQVLLSDGGSSTLQINGGAALPSAADVIKASLWWFEPNIEDGASQVADIDAELCLVSTGACGAFDDQLQRQRYFLWALAGGGQWFIHLDGTDIPASGDSNYLSGQTKRKVYVTWFFEDRARDDADGPASTIE